MIPSLQTSQRISEADIHGIGHSVPALPIIKIAKNKT